MQPQGLHGGHHRGIPSLGHGGFSPTTSPRNHAHAPSVTYEYLFYLPSSDRLWPPTRRKAQGLLSGSSTPGTAGRWLRLKILDTTGSVQWQTTGEPYSLYRIWSHHSWLKRGATNLKRTKLEGSPHLCYRIWPHHS
jgi:hypothetical protein